MKSVRAEGTANLRACKSAALLKRDRRGPRSPPARDLRACKSAALLKLCLPALRPGAQQEPPRVQERGPIEADANALRSECAVIPPRLQERGPIEATQTLGLRSATPDLRACKSAALLKLQLQHVRGGIVQTSALARARPY